MPKVRIDIDADAKKAEDEFKRVQSSFGKLRAGFLQHSRAIGIGMTAAGGAITGLAALAVKSSLEQQVGINRLDQALKNVGTSYEAQKEQIEAVIEAHSRGKLKSPQMTTWG